MWGHDPTHIHVVKPATLVQQKYNSVVVFEHNNGEWIQKKENKE